MRDGIQRIDHLFSCQKAFIGYLTAGDGGINRTFDAAMSLIEGGVNLLEIGVPFSEPVADGPVIQRAMARALSTGTKMADVLSLIEKIRQHSAIPIVLFSYLNPILVQTEKDFFKDAQRVGVDGILLVDCPFEESILLREKILECQMAPIYVISPSTPVDRIKLLTQQGKGFLYYACRKGTTGVKSTLPVDFSNQVRQIKQHINLPLVVGFGISTREMAKKVLREADGVVIGSRIIDAMEKGVSSTELTHLIGEINPQL